MSKREIQ